MQPKVGLHVLVFEHWRLEVGSPHRTTVSRCGTKSSLVMCIVRGSSYPECRFFCHGPMGIYNVACVYAVCIGDVGNNGLWTFRLSN